MDTKNFNPREHLIKVSGKDYLPVAWRIYWFREKYPNGTIETELVQLDNDKNYAVFRATAKTGMGGVATGTKREDKAHFGDFLEKAETGSIGRALAALGFGTQFAGEEFEEGARIVDTPQDMRASDGTRPEKTTDEINGIPYDKKAYGNWVSALLKNIAKKNLDISLICKELEIAHIDKEVLLQMNKYVEEKMPW